VGTKVGTYKVGTKVGTFFRLNNLAEYPVNDVCGSFMVAFNLLPVDAE